MKRIPAAIAAILVLQVGCQGPAAKDISFERQSDPLRPLTQCQFSDDLRVVSVDRLPAEARSRPVYTAEGEKRVSVADGYRVMLAYPGSDYYANMKIEMSENSRYSNDKSTIIQSMYYLSHASSMEAGVRVPVEHKEYRGLELYAINWPTIDFYITNNPPALGGGPIGTYVLFRDSARTVITVYFLNQRPERRKFKSIDEYRTLRDRFLEGYALCVTKSP